MAVAKKISCCPTIAEKSKLLKTLLGEFDFCKESPSNWIKKFERAVRCCIKDPIEAEMDDYFFAYAPYFLNAKHRSWFYNARKDDQTWTDYKKIFVAQFWTKYWNFVEKCFVYEPEEEDSLHEFVIQKIDNLKRLIPDLSDKALIMLCIMDLPEETRPTLQEGIGGSLEMFLSMVEAVDYQLGRSKKILDSDEETVEASKKASDNQEDDISQAGPTSQAGSSSERLFIEKMDEIQKKQQEKMQELLAYALSSEKLEAAVEKVLAKKNTRLT